MNFAVARRTWVIDDPMQIGAVRDPKGGKKGDAKGGKGGKGGGKKGPAAQVATHPGPSSGGGGKGDNPHHGKTCRYCNKMNHIMTDCRKYKADLAAGATKKGNPFSRATPADLKPHSR